MFGREDRFDIKWFMRGLQGQYERICKDVPRGTRQQIEHVLRSYPEEASKQGVGSFGLKITRMTENLLIWDDIKSMVLRLWGEKTHFVSTIRDPITYIDRLFKNPKVLNLVGDHVVMYYDSIIAWEDIIQSGGTVIPYPQAFDDGSIKDYVEKLGFPWTSEAEAIYNKGQPTRLSRDSINDFYNRFSLAHNSLEWYNEIIKTLGREDCFIPMMR
jgi:hypothetical protein